MIRFAILLLLFFSCSFASITLDKEFKSLNNFTIEYFFDKTNTLSISDVSNKEFSEKIPNRFAFGYKKGSNWFKFTITNRSDKNRFILHFNEVVFDKFNFYTSENGIWKEQKNGFSVPLNEKDIKDITPSFEININKDETKTYFIKAKTACSNLGEFQLYEYDFFRMEHKSFLHSMYMMYFGILLLVIILNLFLYIRFRQSIYIYYVGYTSIFAFFVTLFSGYIMHSSLSQWYFELYIAAPLFVAFMILFSDKFLNISAVAPKLHKILHLMVLSLFILAVLILINIEPWYQVMNIFVTFSFLLLIYASIATMIKGNKKSKYYLLAISVYLITMLFMSSMANGWMEYNYFNRYAYLFGSCFEILFFTLMLVNRFYDEQNEKVKISNELMQIKDKKEEDLTQEVSNRENQVREMNIELYHIINDKELLLKELYHRVKNNFQMITSMLWIESVKLENKEAKNSFEGVLNRIKSMSVMHDYLYGAKNPSQIQSAEYLLVIIDNIKNIYGDDKVIVHSDIDSIELNHEQAIALGTIANEVLNNAIKHYDKKNMCGITIFFKNYGNKCLLSIQDNGSGFDDTKTQTNGLGMGIIKEFTEKLDDASFMFIQNSGVRFELSFQV